MIERILVPLDGSAVAEAALGYLSFQFLRTPQTAIVDSTAS